VPFVHCFVAGSGRSFPNVLFFEGYANWTMHRPRFHRTAAGDCAAFASHTCIPSVFICSFWLINHRRLPEVSISFNRFQKLLP
jgi:hypothetical protein